MKNSIRERLLSMSDIEYKLFQSRLMPTVSKDSIIGVRTPHLRKFSKELEKNGGYEEFLYDLPHKFYEENNLHAFLIADISDFDKCIYETERFLPYIDNWATCDGLRPKCFGKNREELLIRIENWIASEHTYTVRFGIEMLMLWFLDQENFKEEYLQKCSMVKCGEYYVDMMLAWFFATALALQYKSAIHYVEDRRLTPFVHNKSIEKALESLRVAEENKKYLRTLKLKI